MIRADEIRASIEKARADEGVKLSDAEWHAIEKAVDDSPPTPAELVEQVASVLCPVVLPSATAADSPSTQTASPSRPRRRRAVRAA